MSFKLIIDGPAFGERSDLAASIITFQTIESVLNAAIRRASMAYDVRPLHLPKLQLGKVTSGSLDIQFLADFVAAVSPLAPQLLERTFQIIESSGALITMATEHFRVENKPLNIKVVNSPGALVFAPAGNNITVSGDIFHTASDSHKPLDKLAGIIRDQKAEKVRLVSHEKNLITLDRKNKNSFNVIPQLIKDTTPVELEVSFYRFNKRTMKGSLEILESEKPELRPFEIDQDDPELFEACMEAFVAPRTKIIAHREVEQNALGELKVKKFHLLEVTPLDDE